MQRTQSASQLYVMCDLKEAKALLTIGGRDREIDFCIYPLVRALNEAGIETVASCCGHGVRPGNIALADGRELIIAQDFKTGRAIDRAFPSITHNQGLNSVQAYSCPHCKAFLLEDFMCWACGGDIQEPPAS